MPLPPPKVLIIEDDKDIVNIMSMNLEANGFEVAGCLKSVEGLQDCLIELPDAIIVDLLMPNMNGFEVLRELKANPVTKDIPVIVCSVIKQDPARDMAKRLGAAAYVGKPFDARELMSTVREVMGLKNPVE
jgi:CheY-like chemotaxis protein